MLNCAIDNKHYLPTITIPTKKQTGIPYWKSNNEDVAMEALKGADELSKSLKRAVKTTTCRRLQVKACSPDSRKIWATVNEAKGKFRDDSHLTIEVNGERKTDPIEVASIFAGFFIDKAKRLSAKTVPEEEIEVKIGSNNIFSITDSMVDVAIAQLKNKKSFGIDGVPLCVIKDTYKYLRPDYLTLMRHCTRKIER